MTFVILTANIDLAVGSVVALSGVVVALLMSKRWDPVLAGAMTLLVATGDGAHGLLSGGSSLTVRPQGGLPP